MDNEIIILSSDEEKEDNPTQTVKPNSSSNGFDDSDFFQNVLSSTPCSSKKSTYPSYKYEVINNCKTRNKIIEEVIEKQLGDDNRPEFVDLVDLSPQKIEKYLHNNTQEKENQNASIFKLPVSSNNDTSSDKLANALENNESKSEDTEEVNTNIYDEFVSKCVSLEKIEGDKEKLEKKLYKYHSKSNQEYVKSKEFCLFVKENMKKLTEKNLYLIAKEVTDELCLQKEIEIRNSWFGRNKHSSESESNEKNNKLNLRQSKVVNKILWKLHKLQKKIQELEETEVDLSDEEDSVYVRLQSYRNKFCQIYKRLCKYTNQVADANRMYCRNISFTGSPYLEINQCIEKWLNKTKRFPDFKDILKLVESQNSSLNMPSQRETVRELAESIFQKVGVQLKERRKYDLWDSFSGYLKDSEDPAKSDPELEKILNENFSVGLKKEQELIKHYAEVQEKEKHEPEEISDAEANLSPNESGNEDENELEAIENSIDQKLYDDIDKELEDNLIQIDDEENEIDLTQQEDSIKIKESKNNFKNCKSLKYRKENNIKSSSERTEPGTSASSTNEKENHLDSDKSISSNKSLNSTENRGKAPLIDYTKNPVIQLKRLSKDIIATYCKRNEIANTKRIVNPYFVAQENEVPAKKLKTDLEVLDFDNIKEKKFQTSNFVVGRCHIQHSFQNIIRYFDESLGVKRNLNGGKIFRDLTNTNKLFNSSGEKKRVGYLSCPTIYKCSINSVQKPLWKKRFKVYRSFSCSKEQRCALSQEEKSQTSVKGDGGSDKNDFQNNSGGGEGGNCNFRSDRGSGSERDNNENDENKKNYKTEDDDPDENKCEDEEEKDDDDEDENENEERAEEEEEEENGNCKTDSKSVEENQSAESSSEILDYERQETNDELEVEKYENVSNQNSPKEMMEEVEETGERDATEDEKEENLESNEEFQGQKSENEENDAEIFFGEGENEKETTMENYDNEVNETALSDKSNCDNEVVAEEVTEKKEDCEPEENENNEETQQVEEENNLDQNYKESSAENIMVVEDAYERMDETKLEENVKNESAAQTRKRRKSKFIPNDHPVEGNLKNSAEESKRVRRLARNKKRQIETEAKTQRINYTTGNRNYEDLITAEATIGEQVVQAQVTLEEEESSNCHSLTNNRLYTRAPDNFFSKKIEIETLRQKFCKQKSTNAPLSPSDEERVKRFLLHSPSSISITPPRKLLLSKPPSQAALQALATLRNLKGISTTRVRTKPRAEDDIVVIGESSRRGAASSTQSRKRSANGVNASKRKANSFPSASHIQSMPSVTPKIVGIQGGVGGFENIPQQKRNRSKNRNASSSNNSSIKISNVWGALPNTFTPSTAQNEAVPSCSYPQARPTTSKAASKKKKSKAVEYVELD